MKKLLFVCFVLLSLSCSDDNGGRTGGCLTASDLGADRLSSKSPSNDVSEELVVEYLNPEGDNLIESGTYKPSEISLDFGKYTQTDVVDVTNEETKYLVKVYGFSKGKNRIEVKLSPSDIDTLLVYAQEVDFSSCTGPVFAIDSVSYNGKMRSFKKVRDWLQKLTIIK